VRFVYFGYPIDQNWSTRAQQLIVEVRLTLMERCAFYDPGAAFVNGKDLLPGPEIWMVNHRALTQCEAAIFVLPQGVPTIGVPREIQVAINAGLPVAVLTDAPSWSLPLIGDFQLFSLEAAGNAAGIALTWLEAMVREKGGRARQAKLPVEIRDEGGQLPARHYADDAGVDLYVSEDTKIEPGTFVDVPTGIAVEIPPVCWGMIKSRSSTLRQKGLLVHDGVIDPGWRGYLFAGVWNLTGEKVEVKAGERIAQLILFTNVTAMYEPAEVLALGESERGGNGFGSTGV
jgi:dUTP pyrophosphatase